MLQLSVKSARDISDMSEMSASYSHWQQACDRFGERLIAVTCARQTQPNRFDDFLECTAATFAYSFGGQCGSNCIPFGSFPSRGFIESQRPHIVVGVTRSLFVERGRFHVNAMATSDARREHVFFGALRDRGPQRLCIRNEKVRALGQLHSKSGVNNVAAGQAEMKPAT